MSVRDQLPLALRLYRLASLAAVPTLAPRFLRWRLSRGKENAARLAERYGRGEPAPAGRAADLAAWRQRRRNARRHPADRTSARQEFCRAHDVRHGDVGGARRATPAGGRGPPIRTARRAAIRRSVPRSLAARSGAVCRVRFVAQSHSHLRRTRNPDDPGQRPGVGAFVSSAGASCRKRSPRC